MLITVDPARDTVQTLEPALRKHHPRFVGLTGMVSQFQRMRELAAESLAKIGARQALPELRAALAKRKVDRERRALIGAISAVEERPPALDVVIAELEKNLAAAEEMFERTKAELIKIESAAEERIEENKALTEALVNQSAAAAEAKWGVPPTAIVDMLALIGDSST